MTVAVAADPVRVAEYTFGHDYYDRAKEIIRAIMRPHAKVAVKGCHASGKTFTTGDIIPLALLMGGDVVTTAPTSDQVRGILWNHVHRAIADSCIPLSEWGRLNTTDIELPTGESAIGRSTDQGVRFQGYHAKPGRFLLVIADESPGVLQAVMKAIEGIEAGGDVRILFLGNPVDPSGPFFEIFAGDAPGWTRITISAFDTPNLAGLTIEDVLAMSEDDLDRNKRPYLVTRRYVRDKYRQWGPDSPDYQGRVLATFPVSSTDALISLAWAEQARDRPRSVSKHVGMTVGIDVAGPGEDETVLCARRGRDVLGCRSWSESDARLPVIEALKRYVPHGLRRVNVDSVGIGWFFYLDLKDALEPFGVVVRPINVGEGSEELDERGNKRFANLKAEYYWHLREQFQEGQVAGLTDQTMLSQLTGVKYTEPRGVVTIEPKEKARARGVKSPDRAEALMLAFAPDDPRADLAGVFGQAMGEVVG